MYSPPGHAMVPRTPWKCTNNSLAACACACGRAWVWMSCFADTTAPATFLPSSTLNTMSGYEFISSALCDEDHSLGGIGLDLLPQTVNVCLQGMGGHISIIPPYLGEELIARHDLALGAVKILKDGGLLLSQPHFLPVGVDDEQLARGLEGVGADLEDGVFAAFVLAEMGSEARQKHV